MADNTIAISAGVGTNVRTVTNSGVDSGAHQQVITVADANGNFVNAALTPTITTPTVNTTTHSVLAQNLLRQGGSMYVETGTFYLAMGTTATTTAYSILLQAGSYYEIPFYYKGAYAGICLTSTATVRVTELT